MARHVVNVACKSCGNLGLDYFYDVPNIPVHSTVLLPTKEEGLGFPTGNLKLAFCRSCGFVQNAVFDASLHDYSTQCEESQGFSPKFNAFLERLTQHLVETYDIRDKSVVEIGCGKGDWLELVCQMGGNTGLGIDPTYIPGRKEHEATRGRARYIQDYYSEQYAHLTGDVMACRHTLEHIAPTRAFMQLVRRAIDGRTDGDPADTLVFFEVPDVERVLIEPAFWDIYYEHCSYFSLGSLARLFRETGFDVLELYKDFDDQYLIIVAKPEARPGAALEADRLTAEDDLEELVAAVASFERQAEETRSHWTRFVRERHEAGKTTVLWGSSSKGVSFLTTLGFADEVAAVVDINPYRQTKFMPGSGHEIIAPEALTELQPDCVIAMNPIYLDEIGADLKRLGVDAELVAV